jgi:hypothetical protein
MDRKERSLSARLDATDAAAVRGWYESFARNKVTTIGELMARAAAMSLPGTEFNDFLFAPIGEDRNGMLVSVLSGLARLEVDPWQEAAKLAQLPGETATQRLASLIGALRDKDWSYLDPPTVAIRLIALLPNRNDTKNQSRNTPHSIGATISSRPWWVRLEFMCMDISVPDSGAILEQRNTFQGNLDDRQALMLSIIPVQI